MWCLATRKTTNKSLAWFSISWCWSECVNHFICFHHWMIQSSSLKKLYRDEKRFLQSMNQRRIWLSLGRDVLSTNNFNLIAFLGLFYYIKSWADSTTWQISYLYLGNFLGNMFESFSSAMLCPYNYRVEQNDNNYKRAWGRLFSPEIWLRMSATFCNKIWGQPW